MLRNNKTLGYRIVKFENVNAQFSVTAYDDIQLTRSNLKGGGGFVY